MRIDMIYYPTDFFPDTPHDIDVEASGRTFTAMLTRRLADEFPGARINVWYNPTEVHSEEEFEIHRDEGEIDPESRSEADRRVRDRVAELAGELRASRDWVVRILV